MIDICLDIETIPMPTADLERVMPPEILNPKMPDDLANRIEPDYADKCPKYASIKDDAEREQKRTAWIEEKQRAFRGKLGADTETWKVACLDARAKFVESAALFAKTGFAKMIGMRVRRSSVVWKPEGTEKARNVGNTESSVDRIYLWEEDPVIVKRVGDYVEGRGAEFYPFMLERQMLSAFTSDYTALMAIDDPESHRLNSRTITFYGHTFDLPFLARRAAIQGSPALMKFLRKHRRGRYLDAQKFVDLCDEWTMGDRGEHSGGLKELAKSLGFPAERCQGDGKTFYRWFQENPEEAAQYLLNDVSMTTHVAEALGVLSPTEESN